AGKPIPNRGDEDAAQAWLRDYVRREGVPAEDLLPTPLRLRKESARLAETVQDLASEAEVRDIVTELNQRIMEWRRIPLGPPIFVPLVDEEDMLSSWGEGQPAAPAATPMVEEIRATALAEPARPRWWQRLSRGGRL